ncbi:alpha/beta hydrolase [Reichenbachiella versicolor]|uniref:alpha/beta hydrolase n=1 Tax=Reichenbachiella versicolor TaxID=1821036 RepID=UPI000D6E8713|nr:alpha/beta hydrolase [Reichenbachiella versicolor]
MGILKRIFRKKGATIVIGVHGLDNKPSKSLLRRWWKNSLTEGLKKIDGAPSHFKFEMAYWADLMYKKPLNPRIKDPNHELHIEEPYIPEPIPSPKIRHTFWHYWKLAYDRIKETIFLSRNGLANYEVLFDMVVKASFKDLDAYFNSDESAEEKLEMKAVKQKVRQRLLYLLRKHKDKRIIILAHSMGSLIAYDVLSQLPEQYEIESFISFGSPIGLPVVREKMARDHKWDYKEDTLLPTPNCVHKWLNYSDPEDHFAVFNNLASYYSPNKHGIMPVDVIVDNDYKDWVTNNAHKSFGYLRTPQLAQEVGETLGLKRKNVWQRGKALLKHKKEKKDSSFSGDPSYSPVSSD